MLGSKFLIFSLNSIIVVSFKIFAGD